MFRFLLTTNDVQVWTRTRSGSRSDKVSFSKNFWTMNTVCLYRCGKEGKFMLCVPKMQIALVLNEK